MFTHRLLKYGSIVVDEESLVPPFSHHDQLHIMLALGFSQLRSLFADSIKSKSVILLDEG